MSAAPLVRSRRWLLKAAATSALMPACGTARAAGRPSIALIIDDMGNLRRDGLRALELPGKITYAFLPHTPYAASLSRLAQRLGKGVILHLPMEAVSGKRLGPGGITSEMDYATLDTTIRAALSAVPHARAVNNHMGSRLTEDYAMMELVMRSLRRHGVKLFLDSRTSGRSVAARAARAAGLSALTRDVFLDHRQDTAFIQRQFEQLVAHARRHGRAVGIGHPYPETIRVLSKELLTLPGRGVDLVPLSALQRVS